MNASYKNAAKDIEQSVTSAAENLGDKVREGGKAAMQAAGDATTAAKRTASDMMEGARDMVDDAKDAASDALAEGQSRLGGVIRKATDTAADAKDAIVAGAGSALETVRDVAVEKADAARESLSDVGERLAATLKGASADSDDDALKSRVLSSVAQGLTTASDALRQRSVTDLTEDLKVLARKHPGAFMVAAAVAGFAVARFMRSSSQRQEPRV
ncbi:hypothetical protein [Tabrizicola sp.]|uniref:hypothetical protein n=1 Tax=Tabrizicola sp. TaxID=2005166 RepID=UPI002FDD0F55